jgi:hypothetical protein
VRAVPDHAGSHPLRHVTSPALHAIRPRAAGRSRGRADTRRPDRPATSSTPPRPPRRDRTPPLIRTAQPPRQRLAVGRPALGPAGLPPPPRDASRSALRRAALPQADPPSRPIIGHREAGRRSRRRPSSPAISPGEKYLPPRTDLRRLFKAGTTTTSPHRTASKPP